MNGMYRQRLAVIAVMLCIIIILTSCAVPQSSEQEVPEVSAESSATEKDTESDIDESVEAELKQQLAEIQAALADITAVPDFNIWGNDIALQAAAEAAIAEIGYPVYNVHQNMPNYEKATEFFDKINAGENAAVTIFMVSAYQGLQVSGRTFIKDETGFYHIYSYAELTPKIIDISDRYSLKEIILTENGNLLAYNVSDSGDEADGYRIMPLPEESVQAYHDYVAIVNAQSYGDGVLDTSWSKNDNFAGLNFPLIFEVLWERENKAQLLAEDNPYYKTLESENQFYAAVPAEIFEGLLQRYFEISTEELRQIEGEFYNYETNLYAMQQIYNPDDNTYYVEGFRGGGYFPVTEVWDVIHNEDSSISLEIATTALTFANDGSVYSVLTVMPQADGSYRYVSNICSDEIIKNRVVEPALQYANEFNILAQGDFKVLEDNATEIDGARFAPIDYENGDYYEKTMMSGLETTEVIEYFLKNCFTNDMAEKYFAKISQMYRNGQRYDGEAGLLLNISAEGKVLTDNIWSTNDFEVLENTGSRVTVRLRCENASGISIKTLTLVRNGRYWLLDSSYEDAS